MCSFNCLFTKIKDIILNINERTTKKYLQDTKHNEIVKNLSIKFGGSMEI